MSGIARAVLLFRSLTPLTAAVVTLVLLGALLAGVAGRSAATLAVNSTADPGDGVCDAAECTLREAIDPADASVGTDTIAFNIPGAGPHAIQPSTATSIPTATPSPGVSSLRVGSVTVPPGTSVTIDVTVDATNLGAYEVDVQYDSTLVTATACTHVHGVCNFDYRPYLPGGTVRIVGIIFPGISGVGVVLGTITFTVGSTEGIAALTVNPATLLLWDDGGNTLTVTPTNGAITIDAAAPTPSPVPPSPPPDGLGDANCDGRIDGSDVMAVLGDVGGIGIPVDCLEKGDVDGDGQITTKDGLLILIFWAGLLASFPASGT